MTKPEKHYPRVAVHAHMHYADLMEQVADYLRHIPFTFDLYVTITDVAAEPSIRSAVDARVPRANLTVIPVPNKGRDVKPFYTDVAPLIAGYDFIGHIHGKKSIFNNGTTTGWLEYLLDRLMGSETTVQTIFDWFLQHPHAGLIYPATFYRMPYWANTWLSNRGWAARLQNRLRLSALPETYFSYPVGNMWWARVSAIKPLLELGLRDSDFPPEAGQNDGEIMHVLERMTTVTARAHGYTNYVINADADGIGEEAVGKDQIGKDAKHTIGKDAKHTIGKDAKHTITLTDDRDGIDLSGYYGSSLDYLREGIGRPHIRVVSFDIFDTLVVRALARPDDIFELMQSEVDRLAGHKVNFRELRVEADGWQRARLEPGTDVTLAAIYQRIGEVLRLPEDICHTLMALELRLETRFMRPRQSVVDVMDFAFESEKTVVLTSDMYLDIDFVKGLLRELGITRYHRLYLSSRIGKRKDAGTMWPHVLAAEGIRPEEMIHIGDNEHSDLQRPGDIGILTFHVMRPMELFRQTALGKAGFPHQQERLSPFARISFGLMLSRVFDDPFPRSTSCVNGNLHHFGYWYFGPVLLAYVKWVATQAMAEGIDTLYFLARDGDILIRIYRLLQERLTAPSPNGIYLEVSRRSVGVPFIRHHAQLDKLLLPHYDGGSLSELIRIRLGIDLAAEAGLDIRAFGFHSIHTRVFIPADLARVTKLCRHLLDRCTGHFAVEKEGSMGYLREMGMFEPGKKAVVDIGYSGTLQRILNEVKAGESSAEAAESKTVDGPRAGAGEPVHGYYMVLYRTFDALLKNPAIRGKALFGDRIDPYRKELSVDRYSLFYEMILSSVRGPVTRYCRDSDGTHRPVYAEVSPDEKYKLSKLPVIHEGILDYCRDMLGLLDSPAQIATDDTDFLLTPFRSFLEQPTAADLDMLAGYSLDDDYCGQGILYWAPPPGNKEVPFLWKKHVPDALLWSGGDGATDRRKHSGFSNTREQEIFSLYQEQYEALPGWFKKIGQVFKILRGTKRLRLRLVLEDVGYSRNQTTKAEEIQAWYDKEYEVLPGWYKRFGRFIRTRSKLHA